MRLTPKSHLKGRKGCTRRGLSSGLLVNFWGAICAISKSRERSDCLLIGLIRYRATGKVVASTVPSDMEVVAEAECRVRVGESIHLGYSTIFSALRDPEQETSRCSDVPVLLE
jgi:hypothetical protein